MAEFDTSTLTPVSTTQAGGVTFDKATLTPVTSSKQESGFMKEAKQQVSQSADTLGRELKTIAKLPHDTLHAIYHAFTDPETDEEAGDRKQAEQSGNTQPNDAFTRGLDRIVAKPVKTAYDYYKKVGTGKIPLADAETDALSVAPEAIGQGAGAALMGKAGDLPEVANKVIPAVIDTAKDATAATIRGTGKAVNAVKNSAPITAPIAGTVMGAVKGGPLGALEGAVGGGVLGKKLAKIPDVPESVTKFSFDKDTPSSARPAPAWKAGPQPASAEGTEIPIEGSSPADSTAVAQKLADRVKANAPTTGKSAIVQGTLKRVNDAITQQFPEIAGMDPQERTFSNLDPFLEKAARGAKGKGQTAQVLNDPQVQNKLTVALNRSGIPWTEAKARVLDFVKGVQAAPKEAP